MAKKAQKPQKIEEIEKVKREIHLGRIIAALVLAIILFSSVFMFGYIVSKNRYDQNYYEQQKILRSFLTLQVERDLLIESCDPDAISLTSQNLDELGYFITLLEEKLGFNDEVLLKQKNDYYLLEAQHMNLVKAQNARCNNDNTIILFFYSNKDELRDRAEEIGFILSTAKKENTKLMVYSFDYDADYSLISLLKNKYKLTDPNSVVINGKITPPIANIDDVRAILSESESTEEIPENTILLN